MFRQGFRALRQAHGPCEPWPDAATVGLALVAASVCRMPQRLVRPAQPSDAADVAVLLGELGYPSEPAAAGERLRRALTSEQDGVLVCEHDGRVVGLAAYQLFALIYRSRPQCRITTLVVHSATRRQGVARGLVEEIESLARDAGCDRLELTTRPDRPEAIHFYTALGFTDRPARLVKPLDRP